jgi:hypothetical protein
MLLQDHPSMGYSARQASPVPLRSAMLSALLPN